MPAPEKPEYLAPAAPEDVPELFELWARAFPSEQPLQERIRSFEEDDGRYGGLDTAWIHRVDGRIAAALKTYKLTQHLRGVVYPMMGLAAVAVAPDFRRRGLASAICQDALRIARNRGDVLSVLYPFKTSFYRRLGYALAGSLHRYRFPPGDMDPPDGWERVRWVRRDEPNPAPEIYGRVAKKSCGLIIRQGPQWRFLKDARLDTVVYWGDDNRAAGYLIWSTRQRRGGGGRTLVVKELVAEREDAYRALVGWLSTQQDQYESVVYEATPSEEFYRYLAHPRRQFRAATRGLWFESASIMRGPMVRVLDVGQALRQSGLVRFIGRLSVEDELFPENLGPWGPSDGKPQTVSIGEFSRSFAEGTLTGLGDSGMAEFAPAPGQGDFRLLDDF